MMTPTTSIRKIIHIDADCFFAAIEMRDDSRLRHVPMAVGSAEVRRGVIATCNYEARKFGIHSAMASSQALRQCPQLIIVPGRMSAYRKASAQMREIFSEYTDLIEPLSLDEAYLDVTVSDRCKGSATLIATEICQRIEETLNITVSAGVAANKFLAKVASDWNKPNGLTVILPSEVAEFVRVLPVERIHGVGKVMAAKMQRLGIKTCEDLQPLSIFKLNEMFGSFGVRLHALCKGCDDRAVVSSRRRKSLSVEHTYRADLYGVQACVDKLPELLRLLNERLAPLTGYDGATGRDKTTEHDETTDNDDANVSRSKELGQADFSVSRSHCYRIHKIFVKIKFSDFTSTTIERIGAYNCLDEYCDLLYEALQRCDSPVRLLGLGVRFVNLGSNSDFFQFSLF